MKMYYVIFHLLLIKTGLCQNVNKLFEDINKEYGKFNALAATLSWDSSVNPDNDLQAEAAKYQKELIIWQQRTCGTLLVLYTRGLLNSTQVRQSYLLCRGPKFTYEEARLSSTLYEKLQSIYSNTDVCIPIYKDIKNNDPAEIEAAILNFLLSVKRNSKSNDYVLYAVKLSAYGDMKNAKVFCMRGENEFQRMMGFSKIEEVLRWLWLVWREKVSPAMKEPYRKFVQIENQASRRNGYTDIGSSWRSDLEIKDLRLKCRLLYDNILPLYKMLHGVARFYLRNKYGEIVPESGPIPAHLLGDLWSQNWESLSDLILWDSIDLNSGIKEKNWTVSHMVKRAEDYYSSLGLPPMTETFWRKSVFQRENTSLRCHGAAADMFNVGDFSDGFSNLRIIATKALPPYHGVSHDVSLHRKLRLNKELDRMLYCLNPSMEDFYGLHHELGHIQYYMAYENQPSIFRQANAAFHEALGDTIMLGVMTPQHLHRLGLIDDKTLYNIDITNKTKMAFDNRLIDNKLTAKNNRRRKRESSVDDRQTKVINNKITFCDDKNSSTEVQNQMFEKNVANNCEGCYKNHINYSQNNRELKRKKRTKRQRSMYDDVRHSMQKLKRLNIAKAERVTDSIITDTDNDKFKHKFYKRSLNSLYNVRKEIALNAKPRNFKTREMFRDTFESEDEKDIFMVNMKLDDILMIRQALNKLPQIPFALIIDEYRWKYFEGSLKDVNGDFWRMTLELQGIAPPGVRGEEYFDVAAKFHVPDNTPYIRYFLSSFLQHQLFETLCKAAVFGRRNPDEPLPDTISMNRCDIYGSKIVGKILKDFMSRGNSKHWRDILEEVTGERDISSSALLRYYRPLYELLTTIIRKHDIPIGW